MELPSNLPHEASSLRPFVDRFEEARSKASARSCVGLARTLLDKMNEGWDRYQDLVRQTNFESSVAMEHFGVIWEEVYGPVNRERFVIDLASSLRLAQSPGSVPERVFPFLSRLIAKPHTDFGTLTKINFKRLSRLAEEEHIKRGVGAQFAIGALMRSGLALVTQRWLESCHGIEGLISAMNYGPIVFFHRVVAETDPDSIDLDLEADAEWYSAVDDNLELNLDRGPRRETDLDSIVSSTNRGIRHHLACILAQLARTLPLSIQPGLWCSTIPVFTVGYCLSEIRTSLVAIDEYGIEGLRGDGPKIRRILERLPDDDLSSVSHESRLELAIHLGLLAERHLHERSRYRFMVLRFLNDVVWMQGILFDGEKRSLGKAMTRRAYRKMEDLSSLDPACEARFLHVKANFIHAQVVAGKSPEEDVDIAYACYEKAVIVCESLREKNPADFPLYVAFQALFMHWVLATRLGQVEIAAKVWASLWGKYRVTCKLEIPALLMFIETVRGMTLHGNIEDKFEAQVAELLNRAAARSRDRSARESIRELANLFDPKKGHFLRDTGSWNPL